MAPEGSDILERQDLWRRWRRTRSSIIITLFRSNALHFLSDGGRASRGGLGGVFEARDRWWRRRGWFHRRRRQIGLVGVARLGTLAAARLPTLGASGSSRLGRLARTALGALRMAYGGGVRVTFGVVGLFILAPLGSTSGLGALATATTRLASLGRSALIVAVIAGLAPLPTGLGGLGSASVRSLGGFGSSPGFGRLAVAVGWWVD